jgi:hypothetical protein
MEKFSFDHHLPLPTDSTKRVEMVVAACLSRGYVNRDVLSECYQLTQLQASVLLREFLHHHSQEIRRHETHNGYILKKHISHKK